MTDQEAQKPEEAPVKAKNKTPVGMIILMVYIGYVVLCYLLAARNPQLLGPIMLSGLGSALQSLVLAGLSVLVFFGILKRKTWAWKLTIGYEIFVFLIAIAAVIAIFLDSEGKIVDFILSYQMSKMGSMDPKVIEMMDKMKPMMKYIMLATALFTGIINTVICIYVYIKRKYFVNK